MSDEIEELTLPEFIEAYDEQSKMQLWDWLVHRGHIKVPEE